VIDAAADNSGMSWWREHPRWREFARALIACALLVGLYYLVPVEPDVDDTVRLVRGLFSVAGVAALAVLITRMVVQLLRDQAGSRPANLLVALFAGVIVFAVLDYQVAVYLPGQFARLETKTDGLYFAVSTLTTVGYGDVHAAGQLGRGLVILQQLFNVAVLTTAGAVLVNRLTNLHPPPAGPPEQGPATDPPPTEPPGAPSGPARR
jgi:voltage-gated potassium channel